MKLLWLRKGDFSDADRQLLAALPDTILEYVSDTSYLRDTLAHAESDVVFASGSWTMEELFAVSASLEGPPPTPLLVRLDDQATPEVTVRRAVELGRVGVPAVADPSTPPDALACWLRELATESSIHRHAHRAIHQPNHDWRARLVGGSKAMFSVLQMVDLVGPRRSTVLITGETGTGKEMVARAIHAAGIRANRPWVPVNCTALPDTLLEAELFGHTKGAFTGAVSARMGRFEEANKGTIFLDEIGDMPLDLQAKLLRVLQEREIQRIGSSETISVDVRVIAATNVDLEEKVADGKFREDLYYRLNVVPIHLPPLRERTSDIPLLAHTFLEKVCRLEEISVKRIPQETMHHLCTYHWPGNVRELENAVEKAAVLSGERPALLPSDFRLPKRQAEGATVHPISGPLQLPHDGLDFEATVGALERELLQQALHRAGGNKRLAAELLRLKRTTLTAKLKSLELAS